MSFRGFLDELGGAGLIEEIDRPISPVLEAAALSWHEGPLFFHHLDGHRCAMNVLGSRDLLARALGMEKSDMVQRLGRIRIEDGQTREVDSSPFFEVISEPDLSRMPILTHFKGDGGPYITAGIVVSRLGDETNASVHRLMVLGKDRLAARLVPGRHTHRLRQKALDQDERLPVAVVIGVDPVILIAASTRVPMSMEFSYASALRRGPVELTTLDNGVAVPHAEIVLEGYIDGETAFEGPFVDITGTMDLVRMEPVIHLTRMMTREDPVYHALLPSGREHKMLMGLPYEPLIFNEVSKVARVKDVLLTEGGCCYLHAVVQIDKRDESDPRRAIDAAMDAHRSLKHVMIVDADIDIHDPQELEYAVATRFRADEDLVVRPNVRGSTLDPRSIDGITTKVGIDATMTLGEEEKFLRIRPELPGDGQV